MRSYARFIGISCRSRWFEALSCQFTEARRGTYFLAASNQSPVKFPKIGAFCSHPSLLGWVKTFCPRATPPQEGRLPCSGQPLERLFSRERRAPGCAPRPLPSRVGRTVPRAEAQAAAVVFKNGEPGGRADSGPESIGRAAGVAQDEFSRRIQALGEPGPCAGQERLMAGDEQAISMAGVE